WKSRHPFKRRAILEAAQYFNNQTFNMDINSKAVNDFFTAFQQGDWKTMQQAYDDDAVFYDPVFENLNAVETRAMWHMLCSRAKDFSLKVIKIDCDKEPVIGKNGEEFIYCKTDWEALYTFSATGRKIRNKVRSNMKLHNGLILEH